MELNLVKLVQQEANSEAGVAESTVLVNDAVFGCKFKEALVHQVVTAYQAGARSGSKAQKTRSEVRGGGIKPWRQKGTGRARSGTIRSPIWRKGGVTFAAKPRDFSQKVNKKMYRSALCSILSKLVAEGRLVLVEDFVLTSPKTKELLKLLRDMSLTEGLIVTDNVDENLYLASRNLYKIAVSDIEGVNPVALVGFEKIIFTLPALKRLEGMLV